MNSKGKNEKVIRHKAICDELNDLYERKNHDYGDSFHQTFLEEGMAMPRIRLSDKLGRFKALTRRDTQQVSDESIRDTLMDLANYAIMTILELEVTRNETCAASKTKNVVSKEPSVPRPKHSHPTQNKKPEETAITGHNREEKQVILERLKAYRRDHGLGCWAEVTKQSGGKISEELLQDAVSGEVQMPIATWRQIAAVLDKMEGVDAKP